MCVCLWTDRLGEDIHHDGHTSELSNKGHVGSVHTN